jgi:uncharacterized protein YjlB
MGICCSQNVFNYVQNVLSTSFKEQYKLYFCTETYQRYIFNHHHWYSAFGPVLAGTRAQSGDRYGSGSLNSRQVLRGSLPLLSPAFRHSHFHHQMPPHPHQCERS